MEIRLAGHREPADLEADVLNAFRDGPLVVASDADARGEVEWTRKGRPGHIYGFPGCPPREAR